METNRQVAHHNESQLEILANGSSRRIQCYDDHMMAVEVYFEKDGFGAAHRHPHSQISYVLSGSFIYTIEGADHVLHTGDSIVVPPDALHGCKATEAGTLLDVFTPCREDFLK